MCYSPMRPTILGRGRSLLQIESPVPVPVVFLDGVGHSERVASTVFTRRGRKSRHYPCFFLAAQRAFMRADNFFRAAALIPRRLAGAGLLFRFAHRCFIASEIRLRAVALMWRRPCRPVIEVAFGGRPRRGADEPALSWSAEIAWSKRARCDLSSANMLCISMAVLPWEIYRWTV